MCSLKNSRDVLQQIQQKKEKVQRALARWARANKILEPGEKLVFTLAVEAGPIVEERRPGLREPRTREETLNMSVYDFFSKARLASVGPWARKYNYGSRIIHCLEDYQRWECNPEGRDCVGVSDPIKTVRQLTACKRNELLAIPLMGRRLLEIIRRLLAAEGLSIQEHSEES